MSVSNYRNYTAAGENTTYITNGLWENCDWYSDWDGDRVVDDLGLKLVAVSR